MRERFGSELRQRYLPVERVGVYVPGGKAAYPSTVLMNIIPAQVAGVKKIVLVSPPDKNGNVHRDVLTAAAILGIKKIFRVGGAQAVAALAYGTKTIPAVDVIVGPGNIFVATAKKMLFGKVGIDSIAGPSEIVILADDSARPDFIASDMAAQAEHDESASSILVTTSPRLAEAVKKELKKLLTHPSEKINYCFITEKSWSYISGERFAARSGGRQSACAGAFGNYYEKRQCNAEKN